MALSVLLLVLLLSQSLLLFGCVVACAGVASVVVCGVVVPFVVVCL